jgi:hypothetical protein
LEDIFEKHHDVNKSSVEVYSAILAYLFLGASSKKPEETSLMNAVKLWMHAFTDLKSDKSDTQREVKRLKQQFLVSSFLPLSILYVDTWAKMDSYYTVTVHHFKEELHKQLDEQTASQFIVLLYSLFRSVKDLRPLENLCEYLANLKVDY